MTYKELQKSGRMIYSYDKRGQGPYTNAYGGTVEYWITPENMVYYHETNDNSMAYTGRSAITTCLGPVKNPRQLERDLNAETMEVFGETLPVGAAYFDQIYADVMGGQY